MDKRKIPARFEESNVIDLDNPTFGIVGQENEIITMKPYSGLASLILRIESRHLRLTPECHCQGRMIAGIDGNSVGQGFTQLYFSAIRSQPDRCIRERAAHE